MWIWLGTLPIVWQVAVFGLTALLVLITVIIVSIYGKAAIQWGKTQIGLGGTESNSDKKKRTCGDCILLTMGKRENLQSDLDMIQKNILKQQMNVAEQKLLECHVEILQTYRSTITSKRDLKKEPDFIREDKEYKIYEGALSQSLYQVKDEIRRSFKENGFEELEQIQFLDYVKGRVQLLVGISTSYVDGKYPNENMIVARVEWLHYIQDIYIHKIEAMCSELFQRAREIKIQSDKEVNSLKTKFKEDIDEFIGKK